MVKCSTLLDLKVVAEIMLESLCSLLDKDEGICVNSKGKKYFVLHKDSHIMIYDYEVGSFIHGKKIKFPKS